MLDWLVENVEALVEYPFLQGIIAAFATFVLEDPTTITCGLLVADGRMAFITAFIGVSLGITIGDLGLYGIGRLIGPKTVSWGIISPQRMDRAKKLFDRNLVIAIVFSRFLPGMRLPTYMGAGFLGASPIRFLAVALIASLVWTFLLLSATIKFGEAMLPLLGDLKWPIAILLIAALIITQRLALAKTQPESAPHQTDAPPVSSFEFWPPLLFYFPVAIQYGWLALRYGSLTLPTNANPSVYSGGMIGEKKSEILNLVAPQYKKWVCRYCSYEKPENAPVTIMIQEVLDLLRRNSLDFPFVAKPDIGQRGAGVQAISNQQDLEAYLDDFPEGETVLFQELSNLPNEAGILYYRFPDVEKGMIYSITLKKFPKIVGDGTKSIAELILEDQRARFCADVYLHRHRKSINKILPRGEELPLVFSGNHCQGAIFRDGSHLESEELKDIVHQIFSSMPEFYYGRLDVKFLSEDQLTRGKDFQIVEINGAGAEATHIWDSTMTLKKAYRILFRQFKILFEIGAQNRRRGFRPLGPIKLIKDFLDYQALQRKYPETN